MSKVVKEHHPRVKKIVQRLRKSMEAVLTRAVVPNTTSGEGTSYAGMGLCKAADIPYCPKSSKRPKFRLVPLDVVLVDDKGSHRIKPHDYEASEDGITIRKSERKESKDESD